MRLRRGLLSGLLYANAKAKGLAIRLARWTGKSQAYVHPKHLLPETEARYWYLAYLNAGDGSGTLIPRSTTERGSALAARASTPSRFIRSGGQLLKAPGGRSSGKIAACQIVPPIRHSCGWGGCSGSGL